MVMIFFIRNKSYQQFPVVNFMANHFTSFPISRQKAQEWISEARLKISRSKLRVDTRDAYH